MGLSSVRGDVQRIGHGRGDAGRDSPNLGHVGREVLGGGSGRIDRAGEIFPDLGVDGLDRDLVGARTGQDGGHPVGLELLNTDKAVGQAGADSTDRKFDRVSDGSLRADHVLEELAIAARRAREKN